MLLEHCKVVNASKFGDWSNKMDQDYGLIQPGLVTRTLSLLVVCLVTHQTGGVTT